jgi:hypothetical protein
MARGLRVSDLSPIDILRITKRAASIRRPRCSRNRARPRTAIGGAALKQGKCARRTTGMVD